MKMVRTNNRVRLIWTTVAFGLMLAGGCAQVQTGVRVVGEDEDSALLEGEWIGTFTNHLGQRTGTIAFSMSGENDTATVRRRGTVEREVGTWRAERLKRAQRNAP